MDELKDAKANAGSAGNRSSNLTGGTHELGRPAQVMLMLPLSLLLSGEAFVIPRHSACTVCLHARRVANRYLLGPLEQGSCGRAHQRSTVCALYMV